MENSKNKLHNYYSGFISLIFENLYEHVLLKKILRACLKDISNSTRKYEHLRQAETDRKAF